MTESISDDRAYAAQLARRYYYERSITAQTFVETFSETTDPLIEELLELVIHEPERTGMLGVKADEYSKRYWPHVAAVLVELDKGEAGVLPAQRRFTKKTLFWIAVLLIFAAASAGEHMLTLARHARGIEPLGSGMLLVEIAGTVLMMLVTLTVAAAFLRGIRFFRAARRRRASGATDRPSGSA